MQLPFSIEWKSLDHPSPDGKGIARGLQRLLKLKSLEMKSESLLG